MAKRGLQLFLIIIGLVAVVTGFLTFVTGVQDAFYGVSTSNTIEGNIVLDSNLRYFSGVWLGLV